MSDRAGGGWLVFCSSPSPPLQSALPLLSPPRVSLIPTEFDPQSAGKLFSLYMLYLQIKGKQKTEGRLSFAFDLIYLLLLRMLYVTR